MIIHKLPCDAKNPSVLQDTDKFLQSSYCCNRCQARRFLVSHFVMAVHLTIGLAQEHEETEPALQARY